MHIILGSQSRDRQKLLRAANIPFTVIVSEFEESEDLKLSPTDLVMEMAKGKSKATVEKVKKTCPKLIGKEAIIICADTMVSMGDKIIGKAHSREDAITILQLLQGQTHEIHTAVVITKYPELIESSFIETTKVTFKQLDIKMIETYISNGEYENRAGAYSINEVASLFIEKIEGSQSNVAGMPMGQLRTAILEFGVDLLDIAAKSSKSD